jgi:hypothetical protein
VLTVDQKPHIDHSNIITNFTDNLYYKVLEKKLKDYFERLNWESFYYNVSFDLKDCYKLIIDNVK